MRSLIVCVVCGFLSGAAACTPAWAKLPPPKPPSPSCPYVDAYWRLAPARLTITLQGRWQGPRASASATETESTDASGGTGVVARSATNIEGNCQFLGLQSQIAPLPTQMKLGGTWKQTFTAAHAAHGSCAAAHASSGGSGGEGIGFSTQPVNVYVNARSPDLPFKLAFTLPPGLACILTSVDVAAPFDVPQSFVLTHPVSVARAVFVSDRRFQVRLHDVHVYSEVWFRYPEGGSTNVHITLTLNGTLTFQPTGCQTETGVTSFVPRC